MTPTLILYYSQVCDTKVDRFQTISEQNLAL